MSALTSKGPLLVAGGSADPNLSRLVEVAGGLGIPLADGRHPLTESPGFCWELGTGKDDCFPSLNQQPLEAAGAFIRYDVFSALSGEAGDPGGPSATAAQRAAGWYQAFYGWLLATPTVRLFNRQALPISASKPATLVWAQQVGLPIPPTLLTNEQTVLERVAREGIQPPKETMAREIAGGAARERAIAQPSKGIAKPVAGGDFCYPLSQLLATAEFRQGHGATPALVQNRLVAPEVRIYIVGDRAFGFEMRSPSLDYRMKQDAQVIALGQRPKETALLKTLMQKLNMDFGAADFKTCPQTGRLMFLELNSSPMFVRFDIAAKGALCQAIVETLVG